MILSRVLVGGLVLFTAAAAVSPAADAKVAAAPVVKASVGAVGRLGEPANLLLTVSDADTATAKLKLQCRVDGADVPCLPGATLPYVAAPGTHTFWVRASDPQLNADTSAVKWTVGTPALPYATVNSSKPEWAHLDDGGKARTVRFSVESRGAVLGGRCWLNRQRVRCPVNRPGGSTFIFTGHLPPGRPTLSFRGIDSSGRVVRTMRHFWTTYPRLVVSADPYASDGRSTVTVTVRTNGSALSCALTQGTTTLRTWSPCRPPVSFDLPATGPLAVFRFSATATDARGANTVTRPIFVDRVAPKPFTSPAGRLLRFPRPLPLSWGVRGEVLPVRYRVQTASGAWNSSLGRWRDRDNTRTRPQVVELDRGDALCVRARAVDAAGNASQWTRPGCRVRPLDERDLKRKGTWNRFRDRKFYGRTGMWAAQRGASLVAKRVTARTIVVRGRRGPTSGTMAVFLDGRRLANVSLQAKVPGRAVVYTHTFRRMARGTLRLVVTSSGKPVTIDAVAISPFAVHL